MWKSPSCPKCGAPIRASARHARWVVCGYCDHPLVPSRRSGSLPVAVPPWTGAPADAGKVRLRVAGSAYVIDGEIGRGPRTTVLAGHRDARLTELVLLSVALRADAPWTDEKWRHLVALSEVTSDHPLAPLLPQPIARGRTGAGLDVQLFRWKSGFAHRLEDLHQAFSGAADPRAATWILRRAAELVALIHDAGFSHGQLSREHILLHTRDHGVAFAGYSMLRRGLGSRLRCADLTDLARAVRSTISASVPKPLLRVVDAAAEGRFDRGRALSEELHRAAGEAFGPPRFVPLDLP